MALLFQKPGVIVMALGTFFTIFSISYAQNSGGMMPVVLIGFGVILFGIALVWLGRVAALRLKSRQ